MWEAAGETDFLQAVARIVAAQLPGDGERTPAPLDVPLTDLGIDSLRTVRLLVQLERDLGIELPPELITADTFRTVRTVADAARRVSGAQQAD